MSRHNIGEEFVDHVTDMAEKVMNPKELFWPDSDDDDEQDDED
jgi:hypothetical protein